MTHGACPVCGRVLKLLRDGRISRHGTKEKGIWPPRNCPGWGQLAVEAAEDEEN